ncbi:MAG: TonB-dependent receptor, partial [bacterium]|nr:TonB-dependent receptor [bacterium]
TLVNVSARFAVPGNSALSGLIVKGAVYNLFDHEYYSPSPVSRRVLDYPHPGRTFTLALEYRF